MSVVSRTERYQPSSVALPERLEGVYKVTEAFRSIAIAWGAISTGAWSTPAIQSFAAMSRRVARDLASLGCGSLDKAVVDLVTGLDAISVTGPISDQQIAHVDHALAAIRVMAVQHLLTLTLGEAMDEGSQAPVFFQSDCPRCASSGICALRRVVHKAKGNMVRPRF